MASPMMDVERVKKSQLPFQCQKKKDCKKANCHFNGRRGESAKKPMANVMKKTQKAKKKSNVKKIVSFCRYFEAYVI